MNSPKQFKSEIIPYGKFAETISNEAIKHEPMFFNSSFHFAYSNGGAITRSFLSSLPTDWHNSNLVFDSRCHMLMPGWYPAIPGWHHDDVPRPEIPTGQHFITAGQPEYDNPRYKSEHIMGLVNADICPTAFAVGDCLMSKVEKDELVYRKWHEEMKIHIEHGTMKVVNATDRTLIGFNCETFHQGVMANTNGWRWFGRVSRNTERVNKITNEIRAQVQVYLEFPMEGW